MDPLQSWHDGCYCYRDEEAEEARQLGFEVKCGGGLPCTCTLFDDSSFAPVDPLFNSAATEEWPPLSSDDPLKSDVWSAQDEQPELQAQVQPPPQQQQQQQKQQRQRTRPIRAGKKRGVPESKRCNCPCRKLHQAYEQKKRCCGDNCACSKGTCACPDHMISTSGRCCETVARHLPSVKMDASVRSAAPLPEPTSDVSSPDNPVDSVFRQVLSASVKVANTRSLLHPATNPGDAFSVTLAATASPPKPKRARTSAKIKPTRSSCCAPATVDQPSLPHALVPSTQSAAVVANGADIVKTEATKLGDEDRSSNTVFSCSDCTLKFASQRELESHGAKKHLKNRPYICYTCSSSFLFKQNRDRHIVEVHQARGHINVHTINVGLRSKTVAG